MRQDLSKQLLLIGPDIWKGTGENPEFIEDPALYRTWREQAASEGLRLKIGRWNLPENPTVILIDITPYYTQKDDIFAQLWEDFRLDSISGQWDYIEPALFGYAAGKVIESFVRYQLPEHERIVAQFHEWMTGLGILYLKQNLPRVATVFTTHATLLGRALSNAGRLLYSRLNEYNPEMVALEYNITAKFSLEKTAAREADCFTAVSELCAKECRAFLKKDPDMITPNGFELPELLPDIFEQKKQTARRRLLSVASALTTETIADNNALLIACGGRYEFHNKGYDVFIKALSALNKHTTSQNTTKIVAFLLVPANHTGPRKDIIHALLSGDNSTHSGDKILTHNLQGADNDIILKALKDAGLNNAPGDRVKVIFAPTYLNGYDGIFNLPIYDLMAGFDISVFPSYYEPWGYTPLESLTLRVPSLVTSLSGFGAWAAEKLGKVESGLTILPRHGGDDNLIVSQIEKWISDYSHKSADEKHLMRETAAKISRIAAWDSLLAYYKHAYQKALNDTKERRNALTDKQLEKTPIERAAADFPRSNKPHWRRIFVQSTLPARLNPLLELAQNLWWCWHNEAIELFKNIAPAIWETAEHNPIALLDQLNIDDFERLLADKLFLENMDTVYARFTDYMQEKRTADEQEPQIAYFCMEYGLHSSIRLYSGGLGVLAGDYLKEASDCNTNMIAIGLLYRFGYFQQALSPYGEQIAQYDAQRFSRLPLLPVKDSHGNWIKIAIPMPGRTLYAKIWLLNVGRVPLYLLDSEVSENTSEDRTITHNLYGGDNEMRLKQEILLGIGGIRMLKALNLEPNIYHCNEGHAAFTAIERLRIAVQENGLTFEEAVEQIRASSLFTTHTPVPAGHDAFSEELMRVYFSQYDEMLNISWQQFMGLGRLSDLNSSERFSVSHLAIHLSQATNGVSRIHGRVSREMFNDMFDGFHEDEVPIGYVTNGVHYPTWISKRWHELYLRAFGTGFVKDQSNSTHWAKIWQASDEEIYDIHLDLKRQLLEKIREKLHADLTRRVNNPRLLFDTISQLEERTLLIGFARRFATYKRATLLFHDLEKLAQLTNHPTRPVRFVFSGKAHPADKGGQALIREIVEISQRPEFVGKILFLENYDMEVARLLVQGVDVWLNNPTRPLEASGTSGMKAIMNGVPNLSVLDGWWAEGYREGAGWALPEQNTYEKPEHQNELDAQTIYSLIENEVAPLFYDYNAEGLPVNWIKMMKKCIAEIAPQFTMKRQLDQYVAQYYKPLYERSRRLEADNRRDIRRLAEWKKKIQHHWAEIELLDMQVFDTTNHPLPMGEAFTADIVLNLGQLSPNDVLLQVVFVQKDAQEQYKILFIENLTLTSHTDSSAKYHCQLPFKLSGVYDYSFRIVPQHKLLGGIQEMNLVRWL